MILAANSVKGAFAEVFFYAYWRGFYFYAWRDPPVSLRLKQEKKAVGGSIPTAFFLVCMRAITIGLIEFYL